MSKWKEHDNKSLNKLLSNIKHISAMKRIYYSLMVLLCLFSYTSSAQTDSLSRKNKIRHFVFGMGINHFNMKDGAMSPVRYQGTSFALNFGTQKEAPKWISRVDLTLGFGSLKSAYYEETERGKTANIRLDLDYTRLQKMGTLGNSSFEWFLGGNFSTFHGVRIHNQLDNSSGIFDSFTSLGISAATRKAFTWKKRQFQFYYQANLPVATLVLRPSFNGLFNFVDPESDFFEERIEEHGLASFGSYFRLNNRFELSYATKGGHNRVLLGYKWDFYHYNKVHKLTTGSHHLYASTMFYF